MKVIIDMPPVATCEVSGCVYNLNRACHAKGITVGDANGHLCDTMMQCGAHSHRLEPGGVGACRAVDCQFNRDFECEAPSVSVDMAGGQAECKTYARK